MSDRLTLARPIDVARQFDHTATQTQIDSDTFQGTGDDSDTLAGMIEDAEDELRSRVSQDLRLSREGVPGQRETFEQASYKVSGHRWFKQSFSRTGRNYDPEPVRRNLDHGRILPFDTSEGDAIYVFRGIRGTNTETWEDISDEKGDTWDILNNRQGTLVIHPIELRRAMLTGGQSIGLSASRLDEVRVAISYRYGALGGSRGYAGQTSLAGSLTADETDTSTVSVENASRLPVGAAGGSIILLLGGEYVSATVDTANDEITVQTRAVRGTSAEAHDSGDRVQYTPGAIRKAVAARAGMQLIQAGRYSAFMPDSEDAIDKGDMMDQLEATWSQTLTVIDS